MREIRSRGGPITFVTRSALRTRSLSPDAEPRIPGTAHDISAIQGAPTYKHPTPGPIRRRAGKAWADHPGLSRTARLSQSRARPGGIPGATGGSHPVGSSLTRTSQMDWAGELLPCQDALSI